MCPLIPCDRWAQPMGFQDCVYPVCQGEGGGLWHLTQTTFLEMGVEMPCLLQFSSSSRFCWHLSEAKREGAELLLVSVLGNKLLFQGASSSVHEVSLFARQALRGVI